MNQMVILKRSWNLWVLFIICFVIGAFYWAAKLSGSEHALYFYGRKARTLGLAMPFLAAAGVIYDLYLRVARNTRLEFSEAGIGDYASSGQLGEIRWEAVDGVAFKRQWLGTIFNISFKPGIPLNDRVESWDNLIVDSLQVTDEDATKISALLAERKITGGLDRS